MNRSLLGVVLAVACVLTSAAPGVAKPVGRHSRPTAHSCRLKAKKHHQAKRCRRRVKRHGTLSAGIPASTSPPPTAPEPSPATSAPATSAPPPTEASAPPIPVPLPVPSAWDRPSLSNPTTVQLSDANHVLVLNQSQDYIVQCPPGTLELSAALNIWGGHNVVLENCDLDITASDWAARFSNQAGTLWIHDVHFGGPDLTGGIQMQEPGATVVMRDVLFDTVYGSLNTNHAELIQTWAGPSRLMIDGLTGATTYQGLFLEPNQFDNGPPPTVFDLRHIDIDDSQGAYALWLGDVNGSPSGDESGAILSWNVQDVYVVPNPVRTWPGWWLWPQPSTGDPTWNSVVAGAPPGGTYVQATPSGATGVDESTSPPALVGEQP
ncbi:MAG: hypothetical protein ACTHMY_15200 [Solirubrobacteraceae bacterium]